MNRIELEAESEGYGPRTTCATVMNNSAQRLTCRTYLLCIIRANLIVFYYLALKQPELISLECRCPFREYEPLEEYRAVCPYVLVTSKSPHSHPIPLPEKTPRTVKTELGKLFEQLSYDLADITPRRFLRHPIVQCYLSTRFPLLHNPMLSDLHISLSNRSHLKVYIDSAKKTHLPQGTGWKGM